MPEDRTEQGDDRVPLPRLEHVESIFRAERVVGYGKPRPGCTLDVRRNCVRLRLIH